MFAIPQSFKIGNTEISTGSLALVLIFVAGVLVFGFYVVDHADTTTWKRLTAIGSALLGAIAGWHAKGATQKK